MKKKLVNKMISTMAAAALVLSLSVTAFADTSVTADDSGSPTPSSGTTAVSLDVSPAYTITIPATVELDKTGSGDETYTKDMTITASAGVRLDEGDTIVVTMSSDSYESGSFNLTADGADTYKLAYTVKVGDSTTAISDGGTVATFTTSVDEQTSELHFAAGDPDYAGSYSDTVTFTIAVQ
ncbi:MAG: hypothetical protein LUI14_07305 [Lachnospiraceae bacterium]|nr:hypothetical protein [Lachnospiraceae bacterium]